MKNNIPKLVLLVLAACGGNSGTPEFAADTLYTNGVIWTGQKGAPDASVMAVKDGVVTYVGDGQGVRIAAQETVDFGGHFVMPGFIDNHVHFLDGGAGLASVDLRDAATPEEFTKRIADYAQSLPQGRWVLNGNWDHEWWGGELPRKEWIDAVTVDTPVFVHRLDGHMALANSAALKLAGVDATTATPDGGEIVRDASGQPTGILKDNAMDLVFAAIPAMSADEKLAAFELAQSHALSLGLTEVHAVTNGPVDASMLDAFRMAHDRGLMKIRVYALTPIDTWESARDLVATEGYGDELLRWGGLKGFVDGSLGSTTAWFYEPFTDAPETSGFPLGDPETLKAAMSDADAAGLKLAVHAIGDKAIDVLIENMRAIAGADIRSRRYRIEHFQHPSSAAIEKAADSGIIASMQPYHAIDDGRWAEKRIGRERIKTTYAFRSLLDAGVILSFGSDWPVAPLSPIEGVYAAVTRRTIDGLNPDGWQPQEKITVEEALSAYTVANAYSGFEEDRAGTLEPGKRADFVMLSEDPREVAPANIRSIEVLETVIDGVSAFRK
ncbi:MAG: amidohydrolase [Gammaproteobacteria bacterium]|nr:amidohydrolase [Gammaproteobacteria bacterium]